MCCCRRWSIYSNILSKPSLLCEDFIQFNTVFLSSLNHQSLSLSFLLLFRPSFPPSFPPSFLPFIPLFLHSFAGLYGCLLDILFLSCLFVLFFSFFLHLLSHISLVAFSLSLLLFPLSSFNSFYCSTLLLFTPPFFLSSLLPPFFLPSFTFPF